MRELIKNYDVWNERSDEFDHTVTVWKKGDNYYQLSHSARVGTFALDSLPTPIPIPMRAFMGRWCPSLTESPQPPPTDSFLKVPRILLPEDYSVDTVGDDSRTPGEDMVAEGEIYEVLRQHRHPNICVYYGCVRDGDYFTALCLKKYGRSLQDAIRDGDCALQPGAVLAGISEGLHFLHHTLELAHNDINPSNVMLDEDGNAVIIDFDSCMRLGKEIGPRKAGTYGWTTDPAPCISAPVWIGAYC